MHVCINNSMYASIHCEHLSVCHPTQRISLERVGLSVGDVQTICFILYLPVVDIATV